MISREDISLKAISIGTVIDLALSIIFSIVVGFIYIASLMKSGVPSSQVEDVIWSTPSFFLVSLTGGLLIVTLSGFITARIAKRAQLLNAALLGCVGVAVGAILVLMEERSYPTWFNVLSFLLVVPCAAAGGYLSQQTMKSGTGP